MKPLSVLRGSFDFYKSKVFYGSLLGISLCGCFCGWSAFGAKAATNVNTSFQNSLQNKVNYNQSITAASFSGANSGADSLIAQSSNSRIYTTIELSDVEEILKETDILYKRESKTLLRFDVSSYKILAILQGCKENSGESCNSLLLATRVRLSSRPNATLVNDWNRIKRGSRAYIDTNDVLVLEADIYAIGGITEQNLQSQIAYFILAVNNFSKHMGLQ